VTTAELLAELAEHDIAIHFRTEKRQLFVGVFIDDVLAGDWKPVRA
jgi:hypothetical protein